MRYLTVILLMLAAGTSFALAQNKTGKEQIAPLYTQVNESLAKGDTTTAHLTLMQLLKLDKPNRSDIYIALGRIAEERRDTNSAETYYKQAIKNNKKSHRAYYSLGSLYYNQAIDILNYTELICVSAPELYTAETGKAVEFLKKALPNLVKGFQLSGNEEIYQPALETVQQIIANHAGK
ncbi:MAG: hypothetical protein LBE56_04550 [Tannerella sp.]|jgi:tetratricopeptide (TPR) repeat protein|nr:hypothetical protein [Tannerella sp.]